MNDPLFALIKLRDMAGAIAQSENGEASAAMYAAARWLLFDLEAHFEGKDSYLMEKLGKLRWSIAALAGMDIDNGKSKDQHLSWALGVINTIERLIQER